MGRKPLPDNLKAARGTLRPCRKKDTAEVATISTAKPPAWLSPYAKKVFKEKVNMLAALRVLTPLDLDNLALYANAMFEAVEAIKDINESGRYETYTNLKTGVISHVVNPSVKILNDSIKVINQIGSQFGFSPASRAVLSKAAAPQEDKDEFSDFDVL